MNRLIWVLSFAIFIQAIPSWGQSGSVIQGDKEWLQPSEFFYYSYNEVSEVCPPPAGVCSGPLPPNDFLPNGSTDLNGYVWASVFDINELFNAYGVEPPFTGPSQERISLSAVEALLEDFYIIIDLCTSISAELLRDPPDAEGNIHVTQIEYNICRPRPEDPYFGKLYNFLPESADAITFGAWFWRSTDTEAAFKVLLEEPVDGETHGGIGNLRGWAIGEGGIERVEVYIDGKYMYDAPYGGERTDVAEVYPDVEGSDRSGFSLAFGYSNLGVGQHTVLARAFNNLGEFVDSTATFEIVAFHKDFINRWDVVDTSQASMSTTEEEILLDNVSVDGQLYELRLKWRTAEQGFEIVEIRK